MYFNTPPARAICTSLILYFKCLVVLLVLLCPWVLLCFTGTKIIVYCISFYFAERSYQRIHSFQIIPSKWIFIISFVNCLSSFVYFNLSFCFVLKCTKILLHLFYFASMTTSIFVLFGHHSQLLLILLAILIYIYQTFIIIFH